MSGKRRMGVAGKRRMAAKRRGGFKKSRLTVNVNRALTPFAQRYITKHKYSQVFALSSLTPAYRFNINSLYDPDLTGVGHQPHGFDQLAAIYNRYRVISCKWKIDVYNAATPIRVAAIATNDVVVPVGVSDIVESPRGQWCVSAPGTRVGRISGRVNMPSLVGRTKAQYMADDRYQSINTGSPQEQCLLQIFGASMSDIGVDGTQCTITLEFAAEWFDPNRLSQS